MCNITKYFENDIRMLSEILLFLSIYVSINEKKVVKTGKSERTNTGFFCFIIHSKKAFPPFSFQKRENDDSIK